MITYSVGGRKFLARRRPFILFYFASGKFRSCHVDCLSLKLYHKDSNRQPQEKMAESGPEQMAARAIARKAYKQAKKKRRAEKKKREQKEQQEAGLEIENNKPAETTVSTKWHRVFREDGCPKATDRPVDDVKISEMLEKRSEAKAVKNYTVSDEITRQLIDMEIVYNDDKKQWHTRILSTVGQKAKKEQARKRESENELPSEEPVLKKMKKK